jgi:hypothetical protein
VSIDGPGREQLRTLAARLKEAGDQGKGFRRELMHQLDEAAQPLARQIADPAHLRSYMPNRYAAVLADDLTVRTQRLLAGSNPRVSVVAKARVHKRKLAVLERGEINHPVFAQGPRRTWDWVNGQTDGMRPRFFADPCEQAVPDIRDHMLEAITVTLERIAP